MATVITTSLTRFQLTDAEQTLGCILTTNQKYVLHNMLADAAEEKVALKFDPLNPVSFAQQEAELQGKIGIIKYILECSNIAEQEHLAEIQSKQS